MISSEGSKFTLFLIAGREQVYMSSMATSVHILTK